MGPLEISLAAAALLIGATGTFSPCGLSVVETIGPTGHTGGRRTTIAACIAFVPGALIGGVATFALLALAGDAVHGAGGEAAYFVAAGIAALAAVLEAKGVKVVPQIRRQVPEHWRRVMPMPLASALYGVLLGLGFTTFVLSFGVWALAGISLAIGDPALGVLVGAAFGLGRAIPIVALAPMAGSRRGTRANELMCENPGVYRGLRAGDALVLGAAALALVVVPGSAGARSVAATGASGPAATTDALAFERLGGEAVLRRGGADLGLPGSDPTIAGPYVATIVGQDVRLYERASLAPLATVAAPGADSIAVSAGWLAYRAELAGGGVGIFARNIADPSAPGPVQTVATAGGAARLSAPSLDGASLVFGVARPRGSRIVQRVLGSRKGRTLVRAGRLLLFDPAIKGRTFVYTRTDARRTRVMIRRVNRRGTGKVLFAIKRRSGTLGATALSERFAFVTVFDPGTTQAASSRIVKLRKKSARRFKQRRPPRGGGNHRL